MCVSSLSRVLRLLGVLERAEGSSESESSELDSESKELVESVLDGETPRMVVNEDVVRSAGVPLSDIEEIAKQEIREIERRHAQMETLFRVGGEEHDMLRVTVRRVCERHQIALLRARRHPC